MGFLTGLFGRKKRKRIDMILDHDGTNWVASRGSLSLSAPTLPELDEKVAKALAGEPEPPSEVFMCCNNEMIPMWIRPYMNHYFNRIVELPLRNGS